LNGKNKESQFKAGWGLTTAKLHDKHALFKFLKNVPKIKSTFRNWKTYEEDVIDDAIADLKKTPKVQWITFASTGDSERRGKKKSKDKY
jgi:hypothetical protein